MAGRDEQRLAAYPAQSCLYGELFFEQRGRIDERPAAESGIGGFETVSYTHLDVSKRQSLSSIGRRM